MRSFFVRLSKSDAVHQFVSDSPLMRRVVDRFVAGDILQDALNVIRTLNRSGIQAALDHLGENTNTLEEARQAADDILAALDGIREEGLRANVSVKLTQLGLGIDKDFCAELLAQILEYARQGDNFVRVDMEDSSVTGATLDIARQMRRRGFDNVGVVIQSYLYRSPDDVRALLAEKMRIRVCKGAYQEPPNLAYPKKRDVNDQFDLLVHMLLDSAAEIPGLSVDGRTPPLVAVATHDVQRIELAKSFAAEIGLPKSHVEFQMLYGIRRDLQMHLAAEGYPVRVYVPYGTQWYPYFVRRLGERPANVWFIVSNFFRK